MTGQSESQEEKDGTIQLSKLGNTKGVSVCSSKGRKKKRERERDAATRWD